MNRALFLSSLLCAGLIACGGDGDNNDNNNPPVDASPPVDTPTPGGQVIRLDDDITANTTFEAKNVYVIPRLKQLFVKNGATLTIEPGTLIQGEQGSVLIITRGSKIIAEGTKDKPIILTSAQKAGERTPGWWGGLLVLGAAPINTNKPDSNEATFEAFSTSIAEGKFGGTDAADNSGTLKYVRIEFAGFEFIMGREFNNLTLAGVGSGTVVDYVQVHRGSDDGIELFGGAVNIKHLLSTQNEDDGFDTDNGWIGKAQFVVVQNITHPATLGDDSNGYEMDNHADPATTYDNLPRNEPTIYNATLIGDPDFAANRKHFAAVLRRGTAGHFYNHIFAGFKLGPEFRDAATKAQLDVTPTPELEIKNSIIWQSPPPAAQAAPAVDIVEDTYIGKPGAELATIKWDTDPGLPTEFTSEMAPKFNLSASSAAMMGGATPPNDGFFDVTATYIGAMGAEDWTAGWAGYPQN